MSRGSQTPIEVTCDVVSECGRFAASNLQNAEPVPEWDIRPGPVRVIWTSPDVRRWSWCHPRCVAKPSLTN